MGAGQIVVKAHADQESRYLPTASSAKCALTDPLPESITYERFWDVLVCSLKEDFKHVPNYKDGALVELDENYFMTFAQTQLGDAEPHVAKMVYRIDKHGGEIYEEKRHAFENSLEWVGVTKVHQDPLQVEYWRQSIGVSPQSRRSGEMPRRYLTAMLRILLKQEITVREVQPSRVFRGLTCAESVDLDDFTNPDDLYDAVLGMVKSQRYNFCLKSVTGITPQPVLDDAEEEAFFIDLVIDGALMKKHACGFAKFGEWPMRYFVQASRKRRHIAIQISHLTHILVETYEFTVVADPLRVESARYVPAESGVSGDENVRLILDGYVNKIANRCRA